MELTLSPVLEWRVEMKNGGRCCGGVESGTGKDVGSGTGVSIGVVAGVVVHAGVKAENVVATRVCAS
jgi:hypothetical protein